MRNLVDKPRVTLDNRSLLVREQSPPYDSLSHHRGPESIGNLSFDLLGLSDMRAHKSEVVGSNPTTACHLRLAFPLRRNR